MLLSLVWLLLPLAAQTQLPNATITTNETAAINTLRRTLNPACQHYQATYGSFPPALANLGSGDKTQPSRKQAGFIPDALAGGSASGYHFMYVSGPPDNQGRITTYVIYADPITPGMTGTRRFYTDHTALIRSNSSGRASPSDPLAR